MTAWVRVFAAVFGAVAVYLFVFAFVSGEDVVDRALTAFVLGVVSVAFWVWADRRKQAAVNAETHDSGERALSGWKPGDPCGACGSTNTGWNPADGGTCNGCGRTDADE